MTAPSGANRDALSLPNSKVLKENFDILSLRGLETTRLNRHLGTRAKATPHRSTRSQVTRRPIPPIHSTAFKMTACGEDASNSKYIEEIDSSCSSAGRRLVVVK